jgi:membrane protein
VSPGAVVGVLLWIGGSVLFSLYLTHSGNYNATYGAAAAVVILLMWFLLSAYSILVGAEINAEMEREAGTATGDSLFVSRSRRRLFHSRRAPAFD